jgi:hypothetical protein
LGDKGEIATPRLQPSFDVFIISKGYPSEDGLQKEFNHVTSSSSFPSLKLMLGFSPSLCYDRRYCQSQV